MISHGFHGLQCVCLYSFSQLPLAQGRFPFPKQTMCPENYAPAVQEDMNKMQLLPFTSDLSSFTCCIDGVTPDTSLMYHWLTETGHTDTRDKKGNVYGDECTLPQHFVYFQAEKNPKQTYFLLWSCATYHFSRKLHFQAKGKGLNIFWTQRK